MRGSPGRAVAARSRRWLAACCLLEISQCGAFVGVGRLWQPGLANNPRLAGVRRVSGWCPGIAQPQDPLGRAPCEPAAGVRALRRGLVLVRAADQHSEGRDAGRKGSTGAGKPALPAANRGRERYGQGSSDLPPRTYNRGRQRYGQGSSDVLGSETLEDDRDYLDWEGSRTISRRVIRVRVRVRVRACV